VRNQLIPAVRRTIYFIGVSTGSSSIMRVFPEWAIHLGLDAQIKGIDLPLDGDPASYRQVVDFIKHDPLSLGALVTTHKINLYRASRDLFDDVGLDTTFIDEVSSISKRYAPDGQALLCGNALDPITSGLALEAVVPANHWRDTDAELLLLGAGGSCLALTLYLHRQVRDGFAVPTRVIVTDDRIERLQEMREVHERLRLALTIEYHHTPTAGDNDVQIATLAPHSLVVNGTGLGKDRPGSPLTNAAQWPARGIAWDFNYRGDLGFLTQAAAQRQRRELTLVDGWIYFIYGWTRVIADIFDVEIATSGTQFDQLSQIALVATGNSV